MVSIRRLLRLAATAAIFSAPATQAQNTIATHVVISEIQLGGTLADDEFVELYNPTASAVSLDGWKLRRKTAGGTESSLVSDFGAGASIGAHGFFLIAPPDVDYDGPAADITYSNTTNRLAANNTVLLYDPFDAVVDKVGLGTAGDSETAAVSNPADNGSVERKASAFSTAATLAAGGAEENAGNGQDTDNNAADFVQQTLSNPQNSGSPPENDIPIPVELLSFSAGIVGAAVRLQWSTASETENLGFHIYRSTAPDTDFRRLNPRLIRGAGNSSRQIDYRFDDRSVVEGTRYYYKLADVDFNGAITFHGPLALTFVTPPAAFTLEQNFPNPFNPGTEIRFTLHGAGEPLVDIFDVRGRPVRSLHPGALRAGSYTIFWDGRDQQGRPAAAGPYFLRLQLGRYEAQRKMTLLR